VSKLSQILLRVVAALGLALPLVAVAATPASASHLVTPFFADHSRNCAYSYTSGNLTWDPITIGGTPQVAVAGVLVDLPTHFCNLLQPGDPFAEFTAYVDGVEVDDETVYLTNTGSSTARHFKFSLSAAGLPNPIIDQVDVRVCRTFGPMLPAFTCGDTQTYHRPQIGPAG